MAALHFPTWYPFATKSRWPIFPTTLMPDYLPSWLSVTNSNSMAGISRHWPLSLPFNFLHPIICLVDMESQINDEIPFINIDRSLPALAFLGLLNVCGLPYAQLSLWSWGQILMESCCYVPGLHWCIISGRILSCLQQGLALLFWRI